MRPADEIDPGFGKKLRQVMEAGVEVLAYSEAISTEGVTLERPLPLVAAVIHDSSLTLRPCF